MLLASLDGSNGFKLSGVANLDRSGISVSAAGDVNGDGFDDLIVGADNAFENGLRRGASYVVFGFATGLPDGSLKVAPDGKSATFTDIDGDLVSVKTTKGAFAADGSNFVFGGNGVPKQLQSLTLDAGFTGANITITAKPGPRSGNGFVNVGFLDATGVDLGTVSIAGDLARLDAGTVGGSIQTSRVEATGSAGTLTVGGDLIGSIVELFPRGTSTFTLVPHSLLGHSRSKAASRRQRLPSVGLTASVRTSEQSP